MGFLKRSWYKLLISFFLTFWIATYLLAWIVHLYTSDPFSLALYTGRTLYTIVGFLLFFPLTLIQDPKLGAAIQFLLFYYTVLLLGFIGIFLCLHSLLFMVFPFFLNRMKRLL